MKRKILFANQCSGSLMIDIVNAYESSGKFDRVELFAGQINIRPSVPNPSVRVIKTIRYNNKNAFLRLATWLVAYLHLLLVCWFRSRDTELFLVTNPPFNTFVPLFSRHPYYLLIYDIYPDTLIHQHFLSRNSFLAKLWTRRNQRVFAAARRVFTISEEMKKVVAQYVEEEKISVVYNWSHNERMVPVPKANNPFLKKYQLEDKFIVLYSGNMGLTHDIEVMVEVAAKMRDDERFHFLFIGDGGKKKLVVQKIAEYGLQNCLVLPYQDNSVLPYSMGAADVGVVTTASEQTGLSIPSKVNAYMSVGAVLLCLAEPSSELGRLVSENDLGHCFRKDEVPAMADFLCKLAGDGGYCSRLKANARQMSYHFTPANAKKFLIDA
ncbi:MAG: glycosyltransferase family 4 protein [Victivallales bacterium]|nr:glycosyltransferase family 4 protein [Victivallales bacterium]